MMGLGEMKLTQFFGEIGPYALRIPTYSTGELGHL